MMLYAARGRDDDRARLEPGATLASGCVTTFAAVMQLDHGADGARGEVGNYQRRQQQVDRKQIAFRELNVIQNAASASYELPSTSRSTS